MSKVVAIFLCVLLAFPASAFANPPDPPEEAPSSSLNLGSFTLLGEGQAAPYAGFLFDQHGVARLLGETEFTLLELRLKHDFELSKSNALWQLKLDNVSAANVSLLERHNSLIKIKDDEISRLRNISLEQPNDYSSWWLAGGVALGILVSVGVFYAAAEGFKD